MYTCPVVDPPPRVAGNPNTSGPAMVGTGAGLGDSVNNAAFEVVTPSIFVKTTRY